LEFSEIKLGVVHFLKMLKNVTRLNGNDLLHKNLLEQCVEDCEPVLSNNSQ
jgi:hypothetical protein